MHRIEDGLNSLGIPFSGLEIERLSGYISELRLWNSRFNLIGNDSDDGIASHILDSLSALPVLRNFEAAEIADIGSGNGLPGMPLSVFLPDTQFVLIERSEKRCGFLRNAAAAAESRNIRVVQADLSSISEIFPLCLCRALDKMEEHLAKIIGCTSAGGHIVLWKGRRDVLQRELNSALPGKPTHTVKIIQMQVPGVDSDRHLVVIKKVCT
jgi:16S rRNA (guanine527-N7)-methyltransferase